jgi:glycosyltransferase involved in cell wall biosynthesis
MRQDSIGHVHAHFGTNSATVAMLAARLAGTSFSMTVHGPEEFDKAGAIGLPEKLRAAAFACAVSSFGASQLRRLVAPDLWARIRIVRCGLERAFYADETGAASPPAASALAAPSPAAPRLVCVGRLSAQKGQITLIEAAAILKRAGRAFEIALIGDGEMRADVEAAARRLDVADRILLLGWKTPAEVAEEIRRARAFVLPSYAEGLPVSIMEALSLERPAISTYVAGIPELVAPGENGWLVPAGDAAALAAAMAEALDAAPERLAEMGRAGRRRVERDHDIDRIAADLAGLFADALAGRAPA